MRNTNNSRTSQTRSLQRRSTSRRNFLRVERLEDRLALAAVPVAVNDLYHTNIDQPLAITAPGILANDTDADGDALVAGLFSGPANGTLSLNENGSFNYQPTAGFVGFDSFMYFASDGALDSLLAAVTIRVAGDGTPPVAVNDTYSVEEDGALTVAISGGVLGNDTDAQGSPMTAALVAGPANGVLALAADGSFSYLPTANFSGVDSFSYTASDASGASNVATATITVEAVNDKPTVANDAYNLAEDGVLTVGALEGVLTNDADLDGDTLTPTIVSQPLHGTVSLSPDGSFTYTPEANYNGLDGFSYYVSDGTTDSDVATATVTIGPVNDLPAVVNDTYTTAEDTPLEIVAPGVLINDSDIDGDALSAVLLAPPVHGTVTLGADGALLYTPDANFNGTDGFSYVASDGSGDSTVASVTITVTPVNDGPVAVADAYSTDEDTTLTVAAAGLLTNDSDIDGDSLVAALIGGPASGTLTVSADGSFSYTPNANFSGTDSFTYTAGDGALTSTATVTLTVNAVNDGPVAAADSYATDEDTTLTVAAAGVLGNDTDGDGDAMTAAIAAGPANGTVTLNADGSFSYTPNANFAGADSFSYTASDGTLASSETIVTITVNAVNDVPSADNDEYTTAEDTPLTVAAPGVLENDEDADGEELTVSLVNLPTNGTVTLNADGSFTYTPNANFAGTDGFSYTVSDGTTTSEAASVTVNVTPANDGPTAAADAYSTDEDTTLTIAAPGVLSNDTDPDGDPLTTLLASGPANGTVTMNADGSFSYTPNANFNGTDSFTYTASDGSLSSAATVSLTVNAVNDGPTAAADSYTTDEDTVLTVAAPGVLGNDIDPDSDPLTAAIGALPASGTVTMNADGSFSYTPTADFAGTDSFTYTASDGTLSSETTVTITVNAVNEAPTAANDIFQIDEDEPLTVDAAGGVMANDTDPDGDPLTATLATGPANGTLSLAADGSFVYTPGANFGGDDSFTYSVSDGSLTSGLATATITVCPVNDAPLAADDAYSVDEDGTLTIAAAGVLTNDSDPESDPLAAALGAGPANGTLSLAADGSFVYTPNANFSGADSFSYTAGDGSLSDEALVTITVNPVADAPVAALDFYSTGEDVPLLVGADLGVLANDLDPAGDGLTAEVITGPEHGTLTLNADGGFTYTSEANYHGADSFTYKAISNGEEMIAAAQIIVEPLNDHPVAVDDEFTLEGDADSLTGGVLANDTDIDGDTLTSNLVSGPAHGTLSLGADGTFSYTPEAGYAGDDSFRYQVFDGKANSNVATMTLHIEEGPVEAPTAPIAADDAFTMDAGTTLTITPPGVLGNDTDPESDPLTATLVAGPANGTLTMNADGSFAYTPAASFTGADSFTYQATDGLGASNTATVTITVEAVENLRPEAVNDSFTVESGVALDVDAAGGLLANDSDPEGAPLTASLFSGPLHGTLSLAANGSFSYTSNAGYVGLDSFLYRVSDGTLWSALAAVTLHVTPSEEPEPAPVPTPTPTPGPNPCLTADEANDLLDALVQTGNDSDAIDSIFANGNWLA
jgi:VCBS repeat-containing protein